ncbi:MAG: fumarylacetoacetate hydrolase [Caulobacteraceae bacterium]|nr:fumarylacetoacetate hydrolase [Caulobacteraceae bacterium]
MRHFILGVLLAGLAVGPAFAVETCRPDDRVKAVAADWLAKRQQPLRDIASGQGTCFRQQLIDLLKPSLGPVIGYKLGAVTKAAQATYKTDRPAVAVLLRDMLLPEGRAVPANFGVNPLWEADFLLVVRDAGINTAVTPQEAYKHLRGYRPFIELPDRGYADGATLTLDQWKALNISGRAGVAGKEIALPQTKAGFDSLAGMTVEVDVVGAEGATIQTISARDALGDPASLALVARDLLREEGVSLKAGDILSLGSLRPASKVKAGDAVTVRYHILRTPDAISVRFQ